MLKKHVKRLERIREILADIRDELDDMSGHYRDKFDNASESWQASERGTDCDDVRDNLESAAADVEAAESAVANLI